MHKKARPTRYKYFIVMQAPRRGKMAKNVLFIGAMFPVVVTFVADLDTFL